MALDLGLTVDLVGGACFLALGAFVLAVRPRRPLNVFLAAYALVLGASAVAVNAGLLLGAPLRFPLVRYGTMVGILSGPLLVLVGLYLVGLRDRTSRWAALFVAALSSLLLYVSVRIRFFPEGTFQPMPLFETIEFMNGTSQALGSEATLLLLALAALLAPHPDLRLAPLAAGVGVLAYFQMGLWWSSLGPAPVWAWGLLAAYLVLIAAPPAIWAVLAITKREARWSLVALSCAAVAFTAGLAAQRIPDVYNSGVLGVARIASVLMVAYFILRRQLFDVDVQIKWTLRRGTVAAAFLAVFFVATQLAQNVLSESYGWAIGGVAAGLLLFAIAPLQRVAERFAERAMPGVLDVGGPAAAEQKRLIYRSALAAAWADRQLSPEDVAHLRSLREHLALAPADYDAMEREAERGLAS